MLIVAELAELVPCSHHESSRKRRAFLQTSQKSDEKKANDAAKRAFLIQRTADYQAQVTAAAVKDPIQTLANRVRKGPLMLLKQVYDKTEQIDIVLRHTHGIRGVMRATLFGFDKYFNMLLADIQEIFVTRQLVTRVTRLATEPEDADAASAGDSSQAAGAERTRTAWKQVLKQRRLPRLILKGDQVVLVHRAVGNIKLPGSLGTRLQAQCDELSL